ncbi:MAG: hypothetical protein U0175_16010 [Caldilineaceae bacterium]
MLPLPVRRLCESALPSRLHIGDVAGIENASLSPLALLRTPVPFKAGGTPVGTIFASSRLTIMDGPFCYCDGKYGQIFWHVCSENGLEGWVAECDHESYQLKPLTIRCSGYGCNLLSPVVWQASNFG